MRAVSITADTQVADGECYLYGAELSHSEATTLIIYNEADSSKTPAKKVINLSVPANGHACIMFPRPMRVDGVYADWTAGVGTVYIG